jgi:hypothetical protein
VFQNVLTRCEPCQQTEECHFEHLQWFKAIIINVQRWEIYMVRCCWWEERIVISWLLCWILWKKTSGRLVQSIVFNYISGQTFLENISNTCSLQTRGSKWCSNMSESPIQLLIYVPRWWYRHVNTTIDSCVTNMTYHTKLGADIYDEVTTKGLATLMKLLIIVWDVTVIIPNKLDSIRK